MCGLQTLVMVIVDTVVMVVIIIVVISEILNVGNHSKWLNRGLAFRYLDVSGDLRDSRIVTNTVSLWQMG
jgi:hypothetical protein